MQKEFSGNEFSKFFTPEGHPVYSQKYIQYLRDKDTKHPGSVKAFIGPKGDCPWRADAAA